MRPSDFRQSNQLLFLQQMPELKALAENQNFQLKAVGTNCIEIVGTRYGVNWIGQPGYEVFFEVVTNYTKDRSWQPLRNQVNGTLKECFDSAIKKYRYWQSKAANTI